VRLAIFSDTHLEFQAGGTVAFWDRVTKHSQANPGSVAVLAGDIINWKKPKHARFTMETFRSLYREVIYVPGNHDSNGLKIGLCNARVEVNCRDLGIHYLRPGHAVTVDDQRFLGGTLWYPHPGNHPATAWFYDYRVHPSVEPAYAHNQDFVDSVCKVMEHGDIIVSHHLPHPRSVSAQFVGHEANHFFLSDQSAWIESRWPKLWIHGHTHDPKDYVVRPADPEEWRARPDNWTRIYCNPMGYAFEGANPAFWDRITLDI
jgi:predicted phosphodiesterase